MYDDTNMNKQSLCHFMPIEGSQIKIKDFVILRGRPCKVLSVEHIKNGKHGGAKFKLLAYDFLTSKNVIYLGPASEKVIEFNIVKKVYRLINIDKKSKVMECLDDNNESVSLQVKDDVNKEIYDKLLREYATDKSYDINVTFVPVPAGDDEYVDFILIESYKEDKD